jgi:hypothetical protein
MTDKILSYPVQAGIMVPMCPIKDRRGNRCGGIMRIPITLREMARIRHGHRKSVTTNFSCKHWDGRKVIVHE